MGSQAQPNFGALGNPWATQGEYNNIYFAIQQALQKMQTATLVQIVSCSATGDVDLIGTVNVTPLVNQVDVNGNPTPHGTIFNLPYLRLAGGSNAIIMDPQAGDIGIAVFASRDISKVQSTQAQANPGSGRQYDWADGIYLSTVISTADPEQYIQLNEDGITAVTPGDLNLTPDGDAVITAGGDVSVTASGNIMLSGASIQAGTTPVAVVLQPLITWINSVLRPALAAAPGGPIVVAAPPPTAVSTVFEAQ